MSDKSKFYADQALIHQRMAEQRARDEARAKANPLPRCLCGFTHHDTEIMVVTEDRWKPPTYYCRTCAPDDVRALCWPDKQTTLL